MELHICIGTESRTELARKVLEFSIRTQLNPSYRVRIYPMSSDSQHAALRGLTGFSLQRWLIPFRFPHLKRAIYLDADQLVFTSIHELWQQPDRQPDPSASIWCTYQRGRPQTSVMVIDCERARNQWLAPDQIEALFSPGKGRRRAYRRIMGGRYLTESPVAIDAGWNHFDHYQSGHTKLLHFTNLRMQPWREPTHPLATLWGAALWQALQAGALTWREVDRELRNYRAPLPGKDWGQGLHPYWRDWLTTHTPAQPLLPLNQLEQVSLPC